MKRKCVPSLPWLMSIGLQRGAMWWAQMNLDSRLRLGLEPELDVQSSGAQEGWSSGGNLGLSTPGLRLRASFLPSHLTTALTPPFYFWGPAQSATVSNAGWTWMTWTLAQTPALLFIFPGSSLQMLYFSSILHPVQSDCKPFQGFMYASGTFQWGPTVTNVLVWWKPVTLQSQIL